MAERIGFILYTAMDPPSPTDYAAYQKLERKLEPDGHVKTLAETHPPIPPMRTEHPAINQTGDQRVYKLASELAPIMDEFHHNILDIARQREVVKYVMNLHENNATSEWKHFRHVDLLHAYIQELLFERVYQRVGRMHAMFERIALREWKESRRFMEEHRDQRLQDSKIFPKLLRQEKEHPYRSEIKEPNQKKPLDRQEEMILADRQLLVQSKLKLEEQRRLLRTMLADELKQQVRLDFIEKRGHSDERLRWHMHDVLRAFDKSWMHAWDSRDSFRNLIRKGIMEQAELYPRLFKESMRDPFETEIRVPNQKGMFENIQQAIDFERLQLSLAKLHEEAGRQLTKDHKLELEAYRLSVSKELEQRRLQSQFQSDVLLDRRNQKDVEESRHRHLAGAAESHGYHFLAASLVPNPSFLIVSDHSSTVPLPMGISGNPLSPVTVAPLPLNLLPKQQKAVWNAVRTEEAEDIRQFLDQRNEGWTKSLQGIRQNLAAIEYGEQKNKELIRHEIKPSAGLDAHLQEMFQDKVKRPDPIPSLSATEWNQAAEVLPSVSKKLEDSMDMLADKAETQARIGSAPEAKPQKKAS